MMTHYLRTKFDTIEEFPFPYNNWGIHPVARTVALEVQLQTAAGQALVAKLPGIPPGRFDTAINTGAADIYVLSFSSELFPGLQRSRSTGMIFPFHNNWLGNTNYSTISYETISEKANGNPYFSGSDWAFMQQEFEYAGWLNELLLSSDISKIFSKLKGKIVIVLTLNEKFGKDRWVLETFGKINAVVQPLADAYGCFTIDMNEYVRSVDDLVEPNDGGGHYKREVYMKLAERVAAICGVQVKNKVPEQLI